MKQKLAIIGSGRMAWIIGKNAHDLGIETHCFANEDHDYLKESIDEFHDISIFEKDEIVKVCKAIHASGVIATTELTIAIAAYVAEKLCTPGMAYQVATEITDKFRNRKACKNVQYLKQPFFAVIEKKEDLSGYQFRYPIIVKPTSKGGKRGITVVYSFEELLNAFDFAKQLSKSDPIIIEEFLEGGREYSVESLSCGGKHYIIQVTEKISSGPPHCVELGHHQPAELTSEMRKRVEMAVTNGLAAIGIDNSTCHTEVKIINDEVYLIEFNARPGGDHIAWPLTDMSTGFHYLQNAIKIAIGEFKGVDYTKFKKHYAGVYFVTRQSGYLKPLFDHCEKYTWLYHKNKVSDELQELEHNDCYGTNSMMYYSDEGHPNVDELLINS